MVHMRLTTFIALSVAVFFGCHRSERSAAKATDTTATDTAAKKTGDVTLTEEELARFLAWMRADVALSDRIEEDTRTMTQEVADRVQPGEDGSRDPQYIAMLERHRSELQADKEAMPLDEERARALTQTIAGIGGYRTEFDERPGLVKGYTHKMFFPGRDEQKLEKDRQKYGKEFVAWVLAREHTITETLAR